MEKDECKERKKGQKLLRLALDKKFSTRYRERYTKYRKHLKDTKFQRKGKQGDNCIRAYSTSQSPKIQEKKKVQVSVKLQRCFRATKIRQNRIFPTLLTVRSATIEFQRRKSVEGWRTRVAAVHQEALTHSVDIPVDIFDVALCSITRPRDHRMCTPVFVS